MQCGCTQPYWAPTDFSHGLSHTSCGSVNWTSLCINVESKCVKPEGTWGLGKAQGSFVVCQTQMILTVIVVTIINSVTFIIIHPLDEKILQEEVPVLSSFPPHPTSSALTDPRVQKHRNLSQGALCSFPHPFQVPRCKRLCTFQCEAKCHGAVGRKTGEKNKEGKTWKKQQNLNLELPEKREHCLSRSSKAICRSHANEPVALLTNLIHLDVVLRKRLMETPAMNTEVIVPLVVFHPFCFCHQF